MDVPRARLSDSPGAAGVGGAGASDAERRSIREVAQEFESLLLLQMITQMRRTFLEEQSDDQGFGGQTMTETIDAELARSLARQGGFGLAASLEQGLTRAAAGVAAAGSGVEPSTKPVATPTRSSASARPAGRLGRTGGPVAGMPTVGAGEAIESDIQPPDLAMPLPDRVSSAFGWRHDPFHGARRFHAGIDIAAAYGRAVPAAAPGRVVTAGAEGAYGLTVVVDHGAGVRTRYAHLSGIDVAVGQELARSEVVGRVGQSGRATGPHLHFEVALHGQKVDPAVVASRVPGGLKFPGDVVDSSVGAVSAGQPAVE
jgi:murein DD-endopeptidase MepM/ murein hydrolase activator NlpD